MKKVHELTNEQAIHIANLTMGGGNEPWFETPRVFRTTHNAVDIVVIANHWDGDLPLKPTGVALNSQWVEIDEGFTVRLSDNTHCEMAAIILYLQTHGFVPLPAGAVWANEGSEY